MEAQFENVTIGQQFFDPYSGEEMVKVCSNAAEYKSGGDAFTGLCTFDHDEIVIV